MKVKELLYLLKLDYVEETDDIYTCNLNYKKGNVLSKFLTEFADNKLERDDYSVVFYTLGNFEMALAFNPLNEGDNSYKLTVTEKSKLL